MLFLAVFCGFLAEYQLEHIIERDREKKFIQTFIEDLKVDTTAINGNLRFQKRKKNQLDSLTYLLREQKIKGYENELYYLARIMVRTTRFQSSDRTITRSNDRIFAAPGSTIQHARTDVLTLKLLRARTPARAGRSARSRRLTAMVRLATDKG